MPMGPETLTVTLGPQHPRELGQSKKFEALVNPAVWKMLRMSMNSLPNFHRLLAVMPRPFTSYS